MEVIMKIGFALTGSFCVFSKVIPQITTLIEAGYEVVPIMSEISYSADTRFGKAEDFCNEIKKLTGSDIIHTIVQAEPFGPQKLVDVLVIAPCSGNTIGKLAGGITDTCVTMAAKGHLRNGRPVVIAVSTNDALSASARNIGTLLNVKNIYFVPMHQDDFVAKPTSVVADFSLIAPTVAEALRGRQLEPLLR
jgi:dipicolinate synthase subunit B